MDRSIVVWIGAALVLVVLMALPLGWLAWLSVSGETGATLAHYRDVFADPALQKALWNTIVLAFWTGLVSVAIGAPLAWLTARTDVPGRGLIRGLVLASFVTPPFLGAFAWVMLAGPNAGMLNTLVAMDLPGAGTVFLSQSLKYLAPAYVGDTLTAEIEVVSLKADKPVCQLKATVVNQAGMTLLEGECWTYTLVPRASSSEEQ